MNLIDIFLYCVGGVFFIFAIIFTYYSLARVRLVQDSRARRIAAVGALLLIIVSVIGSVDIFFFPGSGVRLTVFFMWIGALFVLVYGDLLIGKSIGRIYDKPILKMVGWHPSSIYDLIGISLLVFGGIPIYLLDILRSTSGQFSWYWVSRIGIWAFCFASLAFAARMQSLSGQGRKEEEEEGILLRDDVLTARAYGSLINNLLMAIKPFAGVISESIAEYLEHNPILFGGCKIRQGATIDFEPVVRNLERIDKKYRMQDICTIFSALTARTIDLYGALASPKYANQVFKEIYVATREAFRDSPVFFYILRSLPENILSEEKLALLPREELEVRVQERTRELRQAQAKLQEAKDYTDGVIESMAEALIVTGADGTIREVNQATLDLLGYEENELVGRPIETVLGKGEELSFEKSALHNLVKREVARNVEGTYWSKDGRKIPVLLSGSIMRDNDKIQGFIFLARDITKRKEIEEDRDRLFKAIEITKEAMSVDSSDLVILYTNESMDKLFGYKKGELIGKHVSILNAKPTSEATVRQVVGAIERNGYWEGEVHNKRKDGTEFLSYASITAVKEEGGKIVDYISTQHDITERKKGEEALRESVSKYRSLFENMPDGFAYCKMLSDENNRPIDFVYLEINDAFERLTGLKRENVVGKKVSEAIPGTTESHPELFDIYGKVALTGKETQFDIYFKPLQIWLSIAVYSPRKGYFVAVFNNISDRKEAEEKIRSYQERLRSLASQLTLVEEQEKRHLATELHDSIGQLLALCRIKLGELEKMTEVPDTRSLVQEIEERLEEIIWHTRSLTSELGPPVLYQLGLEAALEWLADYMKEQYGLLTKVKLTGKLEVADEELRIFLFRTAQELLMNVSKHAKTDTARVSVLAENESIQISIEDKGIGFNTAVLDTSFDRDIGFGLFSIRERIQYFGGKFKLRSNPGEGTKVTITVPIED